MIKPSLYMESLILDYYQLLHKRKVISCTPDMFLDFDTYHLYKILRDEQERIDKDLERYYKDNPEARKRDGYQDITNNKYGIGEDPDSLSLYKKITNRDED